MIKSQSCIHKFRRWGKLKYYHLLRIEDTPRKVAWGAAIGVFIGIFPSFGLGIIISFILAWIFKFNKTAAVVGSCIMNFITSPFFWALSMFTGALIMQVDIHQLQEAHANGRILLEEMNISNLMTFLSQSWYLALAYLVGNLIISTIFAVATYWLLLKSILAYRERKRRKRLHLPKKSHRKSKIKTEA